MVRGSGACSGVSFTDKMGKSGWSYSLNGKLAKAPRFDTVESFDKAKNDLYPIHTHIDALGFIWVNLEAAKVPSAAWTDDFGGVDLQPRLAQFEMAEYTFDHAWSMVGDYNWKTLADNYNEVRNHSSHRSMADMFHIVLPLPYSAPRCCFYIRSVEVLCRYSSRPHPALQHRQIRRCWTQNCKHFLLSQRFTYFIVSLYQNHLQDRSDSCRPHFFYIMRCVPVSATTCSMEYEVYRHKNATDEEFHKIDSFFKQVLKEDKDLCNAVQKNFSAGVFVNGKLHPFNEKVWLPLPSKPMHCWC